jgi:phenylpropionate dioxygenase-like ring-hydroxylating dioxygenase large terminal subunit
MHDLLQPGLEPAEVEDLARVDRTHVSLYTDPAIFKQEMEKIFYTTWVFVGHES